MANLLKVPIILSTFTLFSVNANVYDFGNSCASQGSWTSQALVMSKSIKETIMQLKDDPNCNGIMSAFNDIEMPTTPEARSQRDKRDEVNSSVSSLQAAVDAGNTNALSAMLGQVLERTTFLTNNQSSSETRAISVGLDSLSRLFDELPNADLCLHAKPGLASTLLNSSAKMLSAYAASGETNMSGLGNIISKYIKLIRDRKYTKVLNQINDMEFASSISCLIESTAENYCRVKDAESLLNYASEEKDLYLKNKENNSKYNPLEGYFILTRETPIISEWIQKVMFGVTPRTNADSNFKNQIIQNVNEFLQAENSLMGAYQERVLNYESATTLESKKNHIFKTLQQLMSDIAGGYGRRDGAINFFTETQSEEKIAFGLIGIEVPRIVAVGDPDGTGAPPMPWERFVQNGGEFIPAFEDPDNLLMQMGVRLQGFIDAAKMNASAYFQKRLIVDKQNLVDQSLVSQTISVYESFKRIEVYLTKLIDRAEESSNIEDKILMTSMVKTRLNLRRILESYSILDKRVDEILQMNSTEATETLETSDEITGLIFEIINRVYIEFNVIVQRDTYVMNRMNTYVRYDYMYYTKHGDTLTDYQRDLLIVAGKNIVDILSTAYQDNPAQVKMDLANAQIINTQNLTALEDTFRDKLANVISRFKLIADGRGDAWITQALHADRRWWKDSMSEHNLKMQSWDEANETVLDRTLNKFHAPNPVKLVWRYFMNHDRYNVEGNVFEKAIIERDTEEGAWELIKSKLCTQTLGFSKYFQYYYLCEDSTLYGIEKENDDLNLFYNELYQNYLNLDMTKGGGLFSIRREDKEKVELLKKRKDENICALRDFRRKNHAHWLIKQVAE